MYLSASVTPVADFRETLEAATVFLLFACAMAASSASVFVPLDGFAPLSVGAVFAPLFVWDCCGAEGDCCPMDGVPVFIGGVYVSVEGVSVSVEGVSVSAASFVQCAYSVCALVILTVVLLVTWLPPLADVYQPENV